jgi:hypothetical protein
MITTEGITNLYHLAKESYKLVIRILYFDVYLNFDVGA